MKKYESKTKVKLKTDVLLKWRAKREFTQAQAAEFVGVSAPTYKNAEYGNEIQLLSASRISKRIRVPLEELEERTA